MANEIIVSNNKLLREHLVHPHLYWQHNVNNCITSKTSIKPDPPHTPNHFLKTNFVTWSSYMYDILHNLPEMPFLLQKMQEMISIKPMQDCR